MSSIFKRCKILIKLIEKIVEEFRCPACNGTGIDKKKSSWYKYKKKTGITAIFKCRECVGTGRTGMFVLEPIKGDPKQWRWDSERNALGNPKFGRVQVMAVCDPLMGAKYEAPIYTESRGEVNVAVNDESEIAFVVQNRHTVIPIEHLNKTWWGSLPEVAEIKQGVTVVELPRGFTEGVMKESEEETGFRVSPVEQIGNINPNTGIFATSPIVWVGKATKIPLITPEDPLEKILKVFWLTPEETRDLDTICGFTDAVLRKFRLWALRQENPFWRDIGERM